MKKIFFGATALLLFSFGTKAQTTTTTTTTVTTTTAPAAATGPAQSIYVELLGPGITLSANYDTRFTNHRDGIGGRVGVGYYSSGGSIFSLPVQVNYLLGKNGKYFEVGGGATYVSTANGYTDDIISSNYYNSGSSTVFGTLTFGYRSQPIDGGFNFRANIGPIFNSHNFVPFFGISFGYTFP
jgi:hypothetical protein